MRRGINVSSLLIFLSCISNKCVALGAKQASSQPGICSKPYAIFEKCSSNTESTSTTALGGWTTSTAAATTRSTITTTTRQSTTTSFFVDPCIVKAFPELTVNERGKRACPLRNPDGSQGPLLVVRAVNKTGGLVTVANLQLLSSYDGMRALETRMVNSKIETILVSSFVCASVDSTRCACGPMPPPTRPDARCTSPPALFASPCPNKFWYSGGYVLRYVMGKDTFLMCNDGVYILYFRDNFVMREQIQGCCGD